MKRYLASLVIRKMKSKIPVMYHFTHIRLAIIKKKTDKNKCHEDMKKLKPIFC